MTHPRDRGDVVGYIRRGSRDPFADSQYRLLRGKHFSAATGLSELSDASIVGICSEIGHGEELVRE
jgi:hypothetical protein